MTEQPTVPGSPTSDVAVDEFLCLALYRASRAMTATYRALLADVGLTYPQYLVLALLWEDGSLTVGQIGQRLSLDSSTLSPLLKRLEALGLVSRTRSVADERSVNIELTEAGSGLRDRLRDVPSRICAATGLELADIHGLVAELRSLAGHIEDEVRVRAVG